MDQFEQLQLNITRRQLLQSASQSVGAAALATLANAGVKTVHLEVGEDTPGAATLYRKLGFRVTGRRQNYYRRADRRRVAAILMTVDLTGQQ